MAWKGDAPRHDIFINDADGQVIVEDVEEGEIPGTEEVEGVLGNIFAVGYNDKDKLL